MVRFHTWMTGRRCLVAALAAGTLLALLLTGWCSFGRVCAHIRQQTLRLHILANSDRPEDQALKLRVRDALAEQCAALFAGAETLEQAEDAAQQALPQLQRTAEAVVAAAGCAQTVRTSLETVWFDTRTYEEYTLPAGRYRALRVELGNADGQNWWCCLFPPLCVAAAADCTEDAGRIWGADGVRIAASDGYEVRFALLEWWERLKESRPR